MRPADANAGLAMADGPFVQDLAKAVANSGDSETAKHWLLGLASDFLRRAGQDHAAWNAYDFAIYDFEAIDQAWAAMRFMADEIGVPDDVLPTLARFIADRLPAVWAKPAFQPHPPATRTLVLADRTHDLVAMFSVGLKPNGSKDPYALRRAAVHWLSQVVTPATVGDQR